MSEFISLHIGGAGVNIGKSYWDLVMNEHKVSTTGQICLQNKTDYSFRSLQEHLNGTYTPRALFIDTEDISLTPLLQSQTYANLTQCLNDDSGGLFNIAKCEIFKNKRENLFNSVRKLAEASDKLESFFLFFGSGGGTGSGLGSSFSESLKDEYKNVNLSSIIIYPSEETVIESFNSSLCTMYALSNSNIIYAYDNLALQNMCFNRLSEPLSKYDDINYLLSHSLANLSSVFRFSNTEISDFQESLILNDYLKIITPGFASLAVSKCPDNDWKSIFKAALDPLNTMVRSNSLNLKFGEANFVFRGDIDNNESLRILSEVSNEVGFLNKIVRSFNFMEAGELAGFVEVGNKSVGMFSNSNAVTDVLKKVMRESESMFKKRAYVHWYIGHGMREDEILEATEMIHSLVDQYKDFGFFR